MDELTAEKTLTYLNHDRNGLATTIKANYYKMSAANILFNIHGGGTFVAGGVIIEYEEDQPSPCSNSQR